MSEPQAFQGAVQPTSGAPAYECQLTSTDGAYPAYGAIAYTIPAGLTLGTLTQLQADYQVPSAPNAGGSPRFVLTLNGTPLMVAIGPPPNFTEPAGNDWRTTSNLIGMEDARFDTGQFPGGNSSMGWAATLALIGADTVVTSVELVVDGGWATPGTPQIVNVRNTEITSTAAGEWSWPNQQVVRVDESGPGLDTPPIAARPVEA